MYGGYGADGKISESERYIIKRPKHRRPGEIGYEIVLNPLVVAAIFKEACDRVVSRSAIPMPPGNPDEEDNGDD